MDRIAMATYNPSLRIQAALQTPVDAVRSDPFTHEGQTRKPL